MTDHELSTKRKVNITFLGTTKKQIEAESVHRLWSELGMAPDLWTLFSNTRKQTLSDQRLMLLDGEELTIIPVSDVRIPLLQRIAELEVQVNRPTTSGPRWKHDCNQCVYIGRGHRHYGPIQPMDGESADLYACLKQGYLTIIMRHSDKPSDNSTPHPMLDIRREREQ